jgi:hypothetical protein
MAHVQIEILLAIQPSTAFTVATGAATCFVDSRSMGTISYPKGGDTLGRGVEHRLESDVLDKLDK